MCGFLVLFKQSFNIETFNQSFEKIQHRGPDHKKVIKEGEAIWGFHRLSIMDLSSNGNQPFHLNQKTLVCNGELFNFKDLRNKLHDYTFQSESDCEVLIPLYETYGIEKMLPMLDAEFVFVLYDGKKKSILAARDPIGIRPMFYGHVNGDVAFASEAKALIDICEEVHPFPPGHYYKDGEFIRFHDIGQTTQLINEALEDVTQQIKTLLEDGVVKRLSADAPLGFLLSGGLDSSLVCAIAAKHLNKSIKTFAIGMKDDPIDLKYAKIVSDYIKSDHTEVMISKDEVIQSLDKVIYLLETYDVTTIRASIGMYLLCKYIHKNTNIKVLLTGEVSDELFGYKYTDYAPHEKAFQEESQKRMRELYMYDVLRADRCISSQSPEARVPFGDLKFVDFVLGLNPKMKMNTYGIGKFLLRKAFQDSQFLPNSILYREKASFSDAVGHSLVDELKAYAESLYKEDDVKNAFKKYPNITPYSKEALLYRDIFEKYYSNQSHWIRNYWMPNNTWDGCKVNDPSARVLNNYGKSGE